MAGRPSHIPRRQVNQLHLSRGRHSTASARASKGLGLRATAQVRKGRRPILPQCKPQRTVPAHPCGAVAREPHAQTPTPPSLPRHHLAAAPPRTHTHARIHSARWLQPLGRGWRCSGADGSTQRYDSAQPAVCSTARSGAAAWAQHNILYTPGFSQRRPPAVRGGVLCTQTPVTRITPTARGAQPKKIVLCYGFRSAPSHEGGLTRLHLQSIWSSNSGVRKTFSLSPCK